MQRIIGSAETSWKSKIIQNIIIRFNEKQSNTCLLSGGRLHLPLHISKLAFRFFLCRKVLIQNPARANHFIFRAMASPRQFVFLILVRIRLPAHERASGWPQSGGSHISDLENWQSSPYGNHTSSKHFPAPLAVNKRQLSHWLTQSLLMSSMLFKLFLHCLTCELELGGFAAAVLACRRPPAGCARLRGPPGAAAAVSAQANS